MKKNIVIKKLKNLELSNMFTLICQKDDLIAILKRLTPAGKMGVQFIVKDNECHIFRCNGFEEVLPVMSLEGDGIVKINFQSLKKALPLFEERNLIIAMTTEGLMINSTMFPYSK